MGFFSLVVKICKRKLVGRLVGFSNTGDGFGVYCLQDWLFIISFFIKKYQILTISLSSTMIRSSISRSLNWSFQFDFPSSFRSLMKAFMDPLSSVQVLNIALKEVDFNATHPMGLIFLISRCFNTSLWFVQIYVNFFFSLFFLSFSVCTNFWTINFITYLQIQVF